MITLGGLKVIVPCGSSSVCCGRKVVRSYGRLVVYLYQILDLFLSVALRSLYLPRMQLTIHQGKENKNNQACKMITTAHHAPGEEGTLYSESGLGDDKSLLKISAAEQIL